ncbi:formate dehydrogenase accessory sulfurtransferase FdhD [Pseudoroseomonas cervicalis]|uniref:formate dehydrogenase accessory sulfurtransferase FdhD n=1 Tax=Teichococcus cervicalis TaxID=204525 RepID=UPI002780056B|nr:formate dehydrogenase accessory sulfurtransferase FdhD [Pseudoroseomonas cervicalis]MDQ1081844.1 FdhD protein [Pseudoroseomonas cervicalis]
MITPQPLIPCTPLRWTAEEPSRPARPRADLLPEEMPVAMTYGRASHAVMMATPRDLADFALGFSLTEGLVTDPAQLTELEVLERPSGIELRMELAPERETALRRRRRHMAGPVGCGLCGLESLAEAARPLPALPPGGASVDAAAIPAALAALSAGQALHHASHALHAAGFWVPGEGPGTGLVALREDVGRHNALDKLVGALVGRGIDARRGAVLLTSRVSVEMVQKAAILGAPVLIAVSAPTALALRSAEACGMTLIARARGGGFDVFCHGGRVAYAAHG